MLEKFEWLSNDSQMKELRDDCVTDELVTEGEEKVGWRVRICDSFG